MKRIIILALPVLLVFASCINASAAAKMNEKHAFLTREYAGLSIAFLGIPEADPAQNITIQVALNCTSMFVSVNTLNLTISGYRNGTERVSLGNFTPFTENVALIFNHTELHNCSLLIPSDVWGPLFGEAFLSYKIGNVPYDYVLGFPTVTIRNTYLESIEVDLANMTLNFGALNNSYSQLLRNYTDIQGSTDELENGRRVIAILVVTTVFFVATTLYLVIKKPRDY